MKRDEHLARRDGLVRPRVAPRDDLVSRLRENQRSVARREEPREIDRERALRAARREHRGFDREERAHRRPRDRRERRHAVTNRARGIERRLQPRTADQRRCATIGEELRDERAVRLFGDRMLMRQTREHAERFCARFAVERERSIRSDDASAERGEESRVVVGRVRFVRERENVVRELQRFDLFERTRRVFHEERVRVERDALRRERRAENFCALAHGVERGGVVCALVDHAARKGRDHFRAVVRADARVRVDEHVRPVSVRRRGFELREVRLERHGEELDARPGMRALERVRNLRDRLLFGVAVRVPHDHRACVDVFTRDERTENAHEKQQSLQSPHYLGTRGCAALPSKSHFACLQHAQLPSAAPLSASKRCIFDGSIASARRSPGFTRAPSASRTTSVGPAWRAHP